MSATIGARRRVCLVTSGNVASNPRLVKEASALSNADYSVWIVAADVIPSLSPFDYSTIAKLACELNRVPWNRPTPIRLFRALRQRVARFAALWFRSVPFAIAVRAHHGLIPALTKAACQHSADLYIAHNLAALPAAAAAAEKHGGRLGFDAEDYHCGELEVTPANRLELRIRRSIEARLLPTCLHLTSASPHISEAYAADYGVKMLPILNVFGLSDAPPRPVRRVASDGHLPSLYWFSQTIGPNRGLEQLIDALALMQTKVRLVLRGNLIPGHLADLRERARTRAGQELASRIEILPVAPPNEMIRLAAAHDLGLAIEPGCNRNNDIALSNKSFTYLLAGVPVLLSRTSAQSRLASDLGAAALLVNIHEPTQVAETLSAYFQESDRQNQARAEAWRIGRERYNWDKEKTRFLDSVEAALARC